MASSDGAFDELSARIGERPLSPWELIDLLKASNLVVERDGEYILTPRATETPEAIAERKRAENLERVRAYRERLKENGDPTSAGKRWRKALMERDHSSCVYCLAIDNLIVEHMIPVERGGKSLPENLVVGCRSCSAKKRGLTPTEARMIFAQEHARVLWSAQAAQLATGVIDSITPPITPLTPPITPLTPIQLHHLHPVDPTAVLPLANAKIGPIFTINKNGAYSDPPPPPLRATSFEAAEEDQVQGSSIVSTGGSGGVEQLVTSIAGFVRNSGNRSDAEEVTSLQRDFPNVDLQSVARDYAGANLTQKPTWQRFRKWVDKEASNPRPVAAARNTGHRPVTKKVHDFR